MLHPYEKTWREINAPLSEWPEVVVVALTTAAMSVVFIGVMVLAGAIEQWFMALPK